MTRTLWVGAGLHALDPAALPGARALLVDGERVAWVGADPADAPPADAVVDLGSAWLTPAFVDAHVHTTATGLAIDGVDLTGAGSLAAAAARLRDVAARKPAGAVVTGSGWDDFTWPEGRALTAADVAAAAPGRTVLLHRVDAHSCVVDPATLAALDLQGVEGVQRDAEGRPTGWLKEQASGVAWNHVRAALPAAQLAAARDAACAKAAALGIGSLHEMGHPDISGHDDAVAWAAGDWPLDVQVWWAELDPDPGHGLRPGGDLFLDGSIGSCTAATTVAYECGGGQTTGTLFHTDEEVGAFFVAATRRGAGAGVHAIGDAAIAQALRALAVAADACGVDAVRACRHRIEHVELARREHVRAMAALGVVASVQPAFDAIWGGPDGLYAARFGREAAGDQQPAEVVRRRGGGPRPELGLHGDAAGALGRGPRSAAPPWGSRHPARGCTGRAHARRALRLRVRTTLARSPGVRAPTSRRGTGIPWPSRTRVCCAAWPRWCAASRCTARPDRNLQHFAAGRKNLGPTLTCAFVETRRSQR